MVFNNNLLLGAAGQGGGYEIDQSIRFNDDDSAYLTRTPGSEGNRRTFTFSTWVKFCTIKAENILFSSWIASGPSAYALIYIDTNFNLRFEDQNASRIITNQVFKDTSAWYHVVVRVDTTDGTSGDRYQMYINGSRVTSFSVEVQPALNYQTNVNKTQPHYLGRNGYSLAMFYSDLYQAETHFIDGTALDASSFGEYNDDGVWIPKAYDGSYGTNGFYITGETASDLGEDFSGNGNDFTSSGLATTDQMLDTPTNNFWTLNPNDPHSSNITISDGNLRAVMGAATTGSVFASMLPETGKWAWKITATLNRGPSSEYPVLGIVPSNNADLSGPMRAGGTGEGYGADGRFFSASLGSNSAYGATWADGDVIEVGWDADNGTLSFWHNGSAQGAAVTGLTGRWKPAQDHFTTSGGDTLSDFGQSGYTPTDSSYKTLCTANLATPTVADGSAYFDASLWTGNDTDGRAITGYNFQPDWVWIKSRSGAYSHNLTDAVRGAGIYLQSNTTDSEVTGPGAFGSTLAFTSDGYTLENGTSDNLYVNAGGETYVGWAWAANGAGSSNTDGDITSTVSANTTAGFSIATYTGNGLSSQTIGHGLGQIPSLVMFKELDSSSYSWQVYHAYLGYTQRLILDGTNAAVSATNIFSAAPTSTVFTIGNSAGINTNSASHVMYSFAEIPGYSSFGSYTGNGSTDGPFAYTGFKPRFIMFKRTNATESWTMLDTARGSANFGSLAGSGGDNPTAGNEMNANIRANTSDTEEDNVAGSRKASFLSNGFKVRNTNTAMNASGSTYIYMAFAEHPFGGDGVAPATAR